ncbi:winged helix-turn-helix domain-containing protein [Mucilaginibacter jinjuensis]|uniref:Crosslink repair DNA glycosylase YcaQ family protein n=1 Tax=Mucilaginibacter jinjuensis TaxID=1176721 RepID=A0ABY7TC09_9SPHI|nr:crosslink repair DNA glycosylase YcaQ family protein [Mucilaginibacter jinjuensis]WCT13863.1 crosslink repair DNA glycosylase YcaQ family protein [Mucilaginibacter jinjuensis]
MIDHLGFIQIDTNYVVERAHHHTLASRIPDYEPNWLYDLQAEGRIFEFFMADSGFMPMHDFRFSLPVKESFSINRKPITKAEVNLMDNVLDRIAREGPLMITDFENDRQEASSGWWDWRPAKMALERLYFDGRLMTTRKKDFKKLYDLPENLIPEDLNTATPAPEEFARHIIRRTLQALGIAQVKEMNWRSRYMKNNLIKQELGKMVTEGEICTIAIDGLKTPPLYILAANKDQEIKLSGDAFILSPFDVLNVFRHRLRDFFDFDYQIECFVPQPKRKYGYFSLPILIGDTFVARMDSKADRKQKTLIVHNLHFEPVELSSEQIDKLVDALKNFVQFNQCRDVVINKSNNDAYVKNIMGALT